MDVLAYVAASLRTATVAALGGAGEVITCPPFAEDSLVAGQFIGRDLIVLNLHGEPNHDRWYGDGLRRAMSAAQLRTFDLRGAGVFAYNCFLGDPGHPMRTALFDAGAAWVIAGAGPNFGGEVNLQGADVLLRWLVCYLKRGWKVDRALAASKMWVRLTPRFTVKARRALADARAFELFWRGT